jgi:hypothetical protein
VKYRSVRKRAPTYFVDAKHYSFLKLPVPRNDTTSGYHNNLGRRILRGKWRGGRDGGRNAEQVTCAKRAFQTSTPTRHPQKRKAKVFGTFPKKYKKNQPEVVRGAYNMWFGAPRSNKRERLINICEQYSTHIFGGAGHSKLHRPRVQRNNNALKSPTLYVRGLYYRRRIITYSILRIATIYLGVLLRIRSELIRCLREFQGVRDDKCAAYLTYVSKFNSEQQHRNHT